MLPTRREQTVAQLSRVVRGSVRPTGLETCATRAEQAVAQLSRVVRGSVSPTGLETCATRAAEQAVAQLSRVVASRVRSTGLETCATRPAEQTVAQLSRVVRSLIFLFCVPLLRAETPDSTQAQVTNLRAWHVEGQTFLSWREVDSHVTESSISVKDLKAIKRNISKNKKLFYRLYRSENPILSLAGLKPIADAPPLTGWNADYYGIYPKPQHQSSRYIVKKGEGPVDSETGIYVHHPADEGKVFYAVTAVRDGKENSALSEANSLKRPVEETTGQGVPVLQRIEKPQSFSYIKGATLHYYVRWEGPPNCAIESKPFDYLVAIPPKPASPAPVGIHLHCWGGSLNGGYGWWYNAEKGAFLVASNQIPYDWWTGYHENYWSGLGKGKSAWQSGVVRPYTQRRLLSFVDWMATKWKVDKNRSFVAGSSMGGSGAPMFAIRNPDRIAWALSWVGVHNPAKTPQFKGSYERVFGKSEYRVRHESGETVWDFYNDAWYLRKHPEKETPFITFSNGKNDGAIGWPQAIEFLNALQETRRPHLFVWGMSGHGQRARMPMDGRERIMPIDIRVDQSLPAFTRCSLDDSPGTATRKSGEQIEKEKKEIAEYNKTNRRKKSLDVFDGKSSGQVNAHLYWKTDDAVDEENSWEMSVGLFRAAPADECTVSITPRRCQDFKPKCGEKFSWKNLDANGKAEQSGEVTADQWGLITLEQVKVRKTGNRIQVFRR